MFGGHDEGGVREVWLCSSEGAGKKNSAEREYEDGGLSAKGGDVGHIRYLPFRGE